MKTPYKFFNVVVSVTTFLILTLCPLHYTQTVVDPVLTLNAPGIVDQDDMCIWVNRNNKSQSTIITSDKAANKLFVYDLDGNVLQTIDVPGMPGNIDIRYNFLLSGVPTDIVGYNDRTNGTIVFYKVDHSTREISFISSFSDGGMTGDNYGFCLYHSINIQKYYAIASSNSTQMKQWELVDNGDGTIGGTLRRTWDNGSSDITEGLVSDDELGFLYASNEGEGIYKYNADPDDPNPAGDLIAPTGENGLTPDVEGITIYYASEGNGYLLASSQGSNDFKVYDRQAPNNYVKTVEVTGVGSTDGIDVANVSLGFAFPLGLFLVHDGTGSPYAIRGCRWEDLELTIDTTYWDPTPVELNSLDVNILDGKAELIWKTSSETNNLGFEIQRSETENNFIKIGFVQGFGTTTENHSYRFVDGSEHFGKIFYRLKQIDLDGSVTYSGIVNADFPSPDNFVLEQNYPNPFNPGTTIRYSIPRTTNIDIKVYNNIGQEVRSLFSGIVSAGSHKVNFDGSDLSSGIYFLKMHFAQQVHTIKMLLLK